MYKQRPHREHAAFGNYALDWGALGAKLRDPVVVEQSKFVSPRQNPQGTVLCCAIIEVEAER
jgi:hypothetical protein